MADFTPQQIEEFLQEFFDVAGTRQYIGARYVPQFGRRGESSIEWDDTAPYEPLTIVTHQGNSYTSRTYVPAGIDIGNQDYWALTSAYNAQVEAYRQEVVQLQTDWVEWKEDTTGDLDEWKEDTTGDLDEWKAQTVDDFEQAIDDLPLILPSDAFTPQRTVADVIAERTLGTQFYGRKVLAITDSWGTEGSYGVTKCWMRQVCEVLNAEYIDLHQGSTGFWYPQTPTDGLRNFETRLREYVAAHTRAELDEIAYLFVSGSPNDANAPDDAALNQAVNSFMQYACATFPKALVYLIPQVASPYMYTSSVAQTENVWQKAASATSIYGITHDDTGPTNYILVPSSPYWLYTTRAGRYDTLMNADHVHPKQVAHNMMTHRMVDFLMGRRFELRAVTSDVICAWLADLSTFDNASAITLTQFKYINMSVKDNSLEMTLRFTVPVSDTTQCVSFGLKQFLPMGSDTWLIGSLGTPRTIVGHAQAIGSQTGKVVPGIIYGRASKTLPNDDSPSPDTAYPTWQIGLQEANLATAFPSDTTIMVMVFVSQTITYDTHR